MPSEAIIMTADFTCRKGLLGIGGEITAPVGLPWRSSRCKNLPDDVRTVQRLLNRFPVTEGGPFPKLAVDGIVGSLTDKAIGHFQAKWGLTPTFSKRPDHIVDPGGKTITRLNQGPTGKIGMPNEFMKNRPVSSIYLCPKAKTLDRDACVYAMMQELAHHAGRPKER